jgi:(+)-pinoresinol hydroxylase
MSTRLQPIHWRLQPIHWRFQPIHWRLPLIHWRPQLIHWNIALLSAAAALTLSATASAAESPSNQGRAVFEKWCAPCHAAGPGNPGTTALAALYKGSKPAALEQRTDLTPAVVKQFVRKGVSVMPFFRKTEISDAELDALAAYLSRKRR